MKRRHAFARRDDNRHQAYLNTNGVSAVSPKRPHWQRRRESFAGHSLINLNLHYTHRRVALGRTLVSAACFSCALAVSLASDWTGGGANWNSNANPGWNGTGVPDGKGAIAHFGAGANASGVTTQNIASGVTIGTLSFSGGNAAVNRTISLTNGITFDQDGVGVGSATISNSNTSTSAANFFTLSGGTITLADELLISNTGGSTNGNGAIQISSNMVGSANITLSNVSTAISQAGSIFLQGPKSFTGSVLVQKGTTTFNFSNGFGGAGNTITIGESGQGSAALLGINVFSGSVANNIVVAAGSGGILTLGSLSASTGVVTYAGTITLNGDLSLSSASTGTGSVTLSNVVSGSGGLTKAGAGIGTLSGANTFTGDTNLAGGGGTLALANTNALQNSTLNYTGGTLRFSSSVSSHAFTFGGLEGSASIALQDSAGTPNPVALSFGNNDANTNYSGVLSAAGSVSKVGNGTLTLSAASGSTYTGGTTVSNGTLLVTNTTGSGTGSGAIVVNNGGTVGGGGFINTGSNTVTINSGGRVRGGTGITASGALSLNGSVTLNAGSIIELALGTSGTHSTLVRSGGTWTLDATQAFDFIDLGATTGTYDNVITGLASAPGSEGNWTILNNGWEGTFSYDGSNIDLTLTAVPEPSTWFAAALAMIAISRSRLRRLVKVSG